MNGLPARALSRLPAPWLLGGATAAIAAALALGSGETEEASPAVAHALRTLSSHPAAPLRVSPGGDLLLEKATHARGWELRVVERRGGRTLASVREPDRQAASQWSPDGAAVAFLADREGDQEYRPWVLDVRSGRTAPAGGPPTTVHQLRWAPDGRRLAYVAVSLRRRAGDLVMLGATRSPAPPVVLVSGVARASGFAWSPDGRAVAAVRHADEGAVWIAGPGRAPLRRAVVPGGEIRELAWSPDGETVAASVRGPGDEFFRIAEVRLRDGRVRPVASAPADLSAPVYLPGGRGVLFHANHDGETRLHLAEGDGEPPRPLFPAEGGATWVGFSPRGDSAYAVLASRTEPPSLHAVPLRRGGRPARVAGGAPRPAPGVRGERTTLASRDGLPVPAYLWRAPARPGRTPGAVVMLHGGPALQAPPSWDAGTELLAGAGHHVIQLNYRGSTGYGRAFETAPSRGGEQVDDVLAACRFATERLGVPPGRVVILGTSFGASLALRAALREPGAMGGVVLVSLVGASPPAAASPGPLPRILAFHGANDAVQRHESAHGRITHALRGGGSWPREGDGWRLVPGEGHIFRRALTWAEVLTAVRTLAESPPASPPPAEARRSP